MPHVYADPNGPVMAAHYPAPTDAYERGLQAIRRVEVLGSASRFVFPLPDTNIVKRAYRIAGVPMSLVFGERDGVVPPEMAHNWSKVFPSASVRTVAGTAHMTPYESDAVAEEVAAMVKNVVAST
jgi:pimeloyl-ACP methyl ester carboxylesterase